MGGEIYLMLLDVVDLIQLRMPLLELNQGLNLVLMKQDMLAKTVLL